MNALVEALGWTLLHFLWQGALIGALFGLFLAVVRSAPRSRYLAGCLAMVAMAGSVLATFSHHYRTSAHDARVASTAPAEPANLFTKQAVLSFSQCRPCHSTVDVPVGKFAASPPTGEEPCMMIGALPNLPSSTDSGSSGDPATNPHLEEERSAATNASPHWWLVGAWLAGVLLLSLRIALSWGLSQRLRDRGTTTVDGSLARSLRKVAEQVGVSLPVRALVSAAVAVPTVVGWLRPVILFPAATLAGLSRSQLEAVLAHELAHIRRHDYLVNLLQLLLETLLFFHPAVWWISRKVREEREHCCDDIAAECCGSPLQYARALATLEEQRHSGVSFGMAANGGSLLARIRRLAGADNSRRAPLIVVSALLLLAGIAVPVAMMSNKDNKPDQPSGQNAKSERVLPLPSAQSEAGLRHLLAKKPEQGIRYDDFLRLTATLDDAALRRLIDELGLAGGEGYAAWLRSALFTEWARRDVDAAIEYVTNEPAGFREIRPTLYAIFAGSRPDSPEQAIHFLNGLSEDPRYLPGKAGRSKLAYPSENWVKVAYKRLFAELAAMDSEVAWNTLADLNPDGKRHRSYRVMVEGFFGGLPDAATVEKFVERMGQPDPFLSIAIASQWMKHDLQAALAWAPPQQRPGQGFNPLGPAVMIGGVRGNAAMRWAQENPEQALQAVRDDALSLLDGHRVHVEADLLRANPHLALELVEAISTRPLWNEGRPYAWAALHTAMYEQGKVKDEDLYPEAGRDNRPPDYEARYESFVAALQHECFSAEHRADLQTRLDTVFYNKPIPLNQGAANN